MSRYFHVESWSNAYKLRFVVCCNKLVNFVILYIFYYSLFCYYVYLCWIKLIMWVTWPTSSDPLVDDNRCYKSYTDAMGNRLYGNYVVLLFYLQLEKYIQYCVTKKPTLQMGSVSESADIWNLSGRVPTCSDLYVNVICPVFATCSLISSDQLSQLFEALTFKQTFCLYVIQKRRRKG